MNYQPTSPSPSQNQGDRARPSTAKSASASKRPSSYRALGALRLDTTDFAALVTNGTVCAEQRGDRIIYKLRFRNARQIVRYIGDETKADAVRNELARLQELRTLEHGLKAAGIAARQLMRQHKTDLEPLLLAEGMTFHGLAFRRPRRRRPIAQKLRRN